MASDVTKHRIKLEEIARHLAQLSQSVAFYSLQVKNDHAVLLEEGLPEMKELLSNAELTLRGE